jgi:hypothetical protein
MIKPLPQVPIYAVRQLASGCWAVLAADEDPQQPAFRCVGVVGLEARQAASKPLPPPRRPIELRQRSRR